jgi:hypothetical protein
MRCSNKLLYEIQKFKNNYNTLIFHELMIPTVVRMAKLSHKDIPEFQTVLYKNGLYNIYINIDNILKDPYSLYHPIKNLEDHVNYRKMIKTNIDKNKI